jgi:fructokinase
MPHPDGSISITSIGEVLFDVYPDKERLCGAPFNFVYHIHKLTGSGTFISCVGRDRFGNEVLTRMQAAGMDTGLVQIDGSHRTGVAQVQLSDGKTPSFTLCGQTKHVVELCRAVSERPEVGQH